PHTLESIALNRHADGAVDPALLPNERLVRAAGPASAGGIASARGLAGLYAAAISGTGEHEPLLKADTIAEVGQLHAAGLDPGAGPDAVTGGDAADGLGFGAVADVRYRFLGAGAFGHGGVAGALGLADPRSGLAFGCTRRRCAFPGGPAPENERLVRAAHRAALALWPARGPHPGTRGAALVVAGRAVPSELDDHLSGVVAAQDPEERLEVVLDALDDGLPVLQLARADPGADLLDELRLQVVVVADQEALNAAAGLDEAGEVAGAGRGLGVVVDGDRPADGDPAVPVEGADG